MIARLFDKDTYNMALNKFYSKSYNAFHLVWNNPPSLEVARQVLQSLQSQKEPFHKVLYYCFGIEGVQPGNVQHVFLSKSRETHILGKTEHLQIYMHTGPWKTTANSIRSQIKKMGYSANVDGAEGSYADNLRYIKKGQQSHEDYVMYTKAGLDHPDYGKDLMFEEWGTPPLTANEASQKKRKERDYAFRDAVFNGASDVELAELDWDRYCRQQAGIKNYRLHQPPVREEPMAIILHIGDTGVGKTAGCYQMFGRANVYEPPISKDGEINYAGYWRHPVVLLDEFYGKFTLHTTLMLLDPYVIREVNAKYGQCWFAPKILYITSNKHPREWYNYVGREKMEASLRRRFYEEALVLENGKKVTDMLTWWPIDGDRWSNIEMPEHHYYDEFIPPQFVKPVVNKRIKLSDIGYKTHEELNAMEEEQKKRPSDILEAETDMELNNEWFPSLTKKQAFTDDLLGLDKEPTPINKEGTWTFKCLVPNCKECPPECHQEPEAQILDLNVDQVLEAHEAANPEIYALQISDEDSYEEMVQHVLGVDIQNPTPEDLEEMVGIREWVKETNRVDEFRARDLQFIEGMTRNLTDADEKANAINDLRHLLITEFQ